MMDRRLYILFLLPLLTALIAFFLTGELLFTALGFVVGYLLVQALRFMLLPPHVHQAVRAYQRGDLEQALALSNRAIEERPERWEPYYLRALIYFAHSELEPAEADARRAVELKPDSDLNHLTLGQILYSQARFEEAEAAFEHAVRLRRGEGMNQFQLAAARYQQDECAQAIPRLRQAIDLGIDNPQLRLLAHYYLARCLEREGQPEEAEAAYSEMQEHAEALGRLKADVERAPHYPALTRLQREVAAIEKRVRPV
ncbi:MAG: tetratricopeptide repeat protein [Candidatus Promineifilaceae bacterium]|nr:tetratricopeptide repeat protein [Candidatus Promineifilaceae bacterium]